MMVSYTRARAEALGIECEVGVMQRTERVVYLGIFSLLNFFVNLFSAAIGYSPRDISLKFALILLLVFSLYTAIQRMVHVMKKLKV
jgi:CDP-diacylglycerol---glycerol-3-phosphate 3-phosphatidyltransferase